MVSRCANPKCNMDFRHLHDGKLFRFDLRRPAEPCVDVPKTICAQKPVHASVYFWLCNDCAAKYKLEFSQGMGVKLLPMQAALPRNAWPKTRMRVTAVAEERTRMHH
jgi:hypothetical protein